MFKKTYALALGVTLLVPFAFNAQAVEKATGFPAISSPCSVSSGRCIIAMNVFLNTPHCARFSGMKSHFYAQGIVNAVTTSDGVQLHDWAQPYDDPMEYIVSICDQPAKSQRLEYNLLFRARGDVERAVRAGKKIFAEVWTEHKAYDGFGLTAMATREEAMRAFGRKRGVGSGHKGGLVEVPMAME